MYPIAAAPRVRSHRRAAELLAEHDPVMARLLDQFGPPAPAPPSEPHFANLVRAITAQQLAAAAARTIHGRLLAALDGEATPERVLGLSTDLMRMAGLSLNKIASIRDLAEKVLDGSLTLHPGELAREADEEVITALSSVRGIGRWTAEVFLFHQLRRLDVWPVDDIGMRRGSSLLWEVPIPSPKELRALGEPYRPYRSVVAWYCWRAYQRHQTVLAPATDKAGTSTGIDD